MERTPAEFMAARERLGMDRSDVARELGIDKRTVSRWESPASPTVPFEQAWEILERHLERHRSAVETALDIIEWQTQEHGAPRDVVLPVYPNEATWRAAHPESNITHEMANATNRAVGEAAEAMGYAISFVWPDTDLIRSMRQKADERFQDRQQ